MFNYKFRNSHHPRAGAEHDSRNLKDVFSRLGYAVDIHEDLGCDETLCKLVEVRSDPTLQKVGALIIFVLSHGESSNTFYTNDGEKLNLVQIRLLFSDTLCPAMKGKPKIFMTNFCRGQYVELQTDSLSTSNESSVRVFSNIEYNDVEVPRNTVIIYSSSQGIKANRSPDYGTTFVKCICEVLETSDERLDLRELYMQLGNTMDTTPEWTDVLFTKYTV